MPSADSHAQVFAGSIHYINNNFHRPIRISELSILANMSYRSYTDQFKRTTGQTVTQYLSRIRIEYAQRVILETEDILFAAYESGFGDLAHFYRVFKTVTGLTPKRFINDKKLPGKLVKPLK